MSELSGIAAARRLPAKALIGDEWVSAVSGATFDSLDPSTVGVLAARPGRGPEDVASAVASESKAFASGDWSRTRLSERKSAPEGAPCAWRLRAEAAPVNCFREGEITAPFAGTNASGSGGSDDGEHALKQHTEMKTIWIELEAS